jgi:hypothetical protein
VAAKVRPGSGRPVAAIPGTTAAMEAAVEPEAKRRAGPEHCARAETAVAAPLALGPAAASVSVTRA